MRLSEGKCVKVWVQVWIFECVREWVFECVGECAWVWVQGAWVIFLIEKVLGGLSNVVPYSRDIVNWESPWAKGCPGRENCRYKGPEANWAFPQKAGGQHGWCKVRNGKNNMRRSHRVSQARLWQALEAMAGLYILHSLWWEAIGDFWKDVCFKRLSFGFCVENRLYSCWISRIQ